VDSAIKTFMNNFGETAIYQRRETMTGDITVIPSTGNNRFAVTKNLRNAVYDREFIVEAETLVIDGEKIKPRPGDKINTDGKTYEVTNNANQQCYTPIDTSDKFCRVFTKKT
jgi:hypothetical protein